MRKITGLTQERFAKYLCIPSANIRNWEQGFRTPPEYVFAMIERIMIMDRYLVDTSRIYVSSDNHISYTMHIKEDGQYTASFQYNGKEYVIDAPCYAHASKRIDSLIIGTGFLVDDKADDIRFEIESGILEDAHDR